MNSILNTNFDSKSLERVDDGEVYDYFTNKTKGVPLASYMQNLYNSKRTDVII